MISLYHSGLLIIPITELNFLQRLLVFCFPFCQAFQPQIVKFEVKPFEQLCDL